jgi:hypothetical protein
MLKDRMRVLALRRARRLKRFLDWSAMAAGVGIGGASIWLTLAVLCG